VDSYIPRVAVVAASLVLGFVTGGESQIAGKVTDGSGAPISAVLVELRSSTRRIVHTNTDETGSFSLRLKEIPDSAVLVFTRLGYSPKIVHGPLPTFVQSSLDPLPIDLPAITVLTAKRLCPNKDEQLARNIWSRAKSFYSRTPAQVGRAVKFLRTSSSVAASEVGNVDETHLEETWSGRSGQHQDPDILAVSEGYGRRINVPAGNYNNWLYPALESWDAHHFASEAFGSLHNLSIATTGGGETLIAFCSKDRGKARIEGSLLISHDTTFANASWRFSTPKPDEQAGGEVIFAPPSVEGYLLPARGVFWRQLSGRKLFHQTASVFLEWHFGADSAIPDVGS
jgi:hypothetical protein